MPGPASEVGMKRTESRPQTIGEKKYSLLGKGNGHQVASETINVDLRKKKFPTLTNVPK